jgi:pimeloyl-ACP methyl ester carboxylesterase
MSDVDLCELCVQANIKGIPSATVVEGNGPVGYVLKGTPAIVVFQGTENVADVFFDLEAWLVEWHGPGRVHKGFLESWLLLKDGISQAVGNRPLILTGQSLGSALATLAAVDLPNKVEKIVTFGSPRPGDHVFAKYFKSTKVHRYVNEADPIPHMPYCLYGYRHIAPCHWFNGTKWTRLNWWSWLKLSFEQLTTEPEMLIEDHFSMNYLKAMEKL